MIAACLEVTVGFTTGHDGRGAGSRSESYAVLRLGDAERRTDVNDGKSSATWNHRLHFALPGVDDRLPKALHVEVFERRRDAPYARLGSCVVHLADAYRRHALDAVEPIRSADGHVAGHMRIHVSLLFQVSPPASAECPVAIVQPAASAQRNPSARPSQRLQEASQLPSQRRTPMTADVPSVGADCGRANVPLATRADRPAARSAREAVAESLIRLLCENMQKRQERAKRKRAEALASEARPSAPLPRMSADGDAGRLKRQRGAAMATVATAGEGGAHAERAEGALSRSALLSLLAARIREQAGARADSPWGDAVASPSPACSSSSPTEGTPRGTPRVARRSDAESNCTRGLLSAAESASPQAPTAHGAAATTGPRVKAATHPRAAPLDARQSPGRTPKAQGPLHLPAATSAKAPIAAGAIQAERMTQRFVPPPPLDLSLLAPVMHGRLPCTSLLALAMQSPGARCLPSPPALRSLAGATGAVSGWGRRQGEGQVDAEARGGGHGVKGKEGSDEAPKVLRGSMVAQRHETQQQRRQQQQQRGRVPWQASEPCKTGMSADGWKKGMTADSGMRGIAADGLVVSTDLSLGLLPSPAAAHPPVPPAAARVN